MLSPLIHWDDTARGLHHGAALLGAIRQLTREHMANWLELGTKVEPDGLSTDRLPAGGEILLDFRRAALAYRPAGGVEVVIPLAGHSQASLLNALLSRMHSGDLGHALGAGSDDDAGGRLIAALAAQGHKHDDLSNDAPLKVDPKLGGAYADALYAIFTGVARFRARLNGHMTSVVVWPEHFDLSTLWFRDADMDDHKPHLNFGFAPFSAGFPRPYLYVYAYPYPPNVTLPPLPAPAYWTTETWTGVVVDYEAIAAQDDAALFVEQVCLGIFDALLPLLG